MDEGSGSHAAGGYASSYRFHNATTKGENAASKHQPKVLPQHHNISEQSGESRQCKGDDEHLGTIPLDKNNKHVKEEKEHNLFIAALEKHGSSSVGAWPAMASELGWTVEDVKVYAYSYFKRLVVRNGSAKKHGTSATRLADNEDGSINEKKKARLSTSATTKDEKAKSSSSWSFHELILLDSLMVKHCQDLSCLDVYQKTEEEEGARFVRRRTVWESIAAQFPGKTAVSCNEKGVSRLLSVYYNEGKATNK